MQMSLFISSLDKLQGIPIIFRCLIWRPSWTARCPLPPASPPAASPSPPGGRRPPWERELMQSGSTREKRKPDFFSICSQPDSCRIKKAAMPRSFAGWHWCQTFLWPSIVGFYGLIPWIPLSYRCIWLCSCTHSCEQTSKCRRQKGNIKTRVLKAK